MDCRPKLLEVIYPQRTCTQPRRTPSAMPCCIDRQANGTRQAGNNKLKRHNADLPTARGVRNPERAALSTGGASVSVVAEPIASSESDSLYGAPTSMGQVVLIIRTTHVSA